MMSEELPEWRKAWKLDNPAWVKQRQTEWKKIKSSYVITSIYTKKEQVMIKNFFMTGYCYKLGEIPSDPIYDWDADTRPLCVRAWALLESWFSPEYSDKNIQRIRKNTDQRTWSDSEGHFHATLKNCQNDENGSVFNGRDKELFSIFSKPRFRPEDYPDFDPKRFAKRAHSRFYQLRSSITKYFGETYYSQSITPIAYQSWIDTIMPACNFVSMSNRRFIDIDLADTINAVNIVVASPENFHNNQVELGNRLLADLRAMSFPKTMIKVKKALNVSEV
jgi:hypothetical protein